MPSPIYKACDIRGDSETELSEDLFGSWGRTLATQLPAGSRFVVGGDVRATTPSFLNALVRGLAGSGLQVLDLGVIPTPLVYFAKRELALDGCAIVTASHSPPSVNGLKWMVGDLPPREADVLALADSAEEAPAGDDSRPGGRVSSLDVTDRYERWLSDTLAGEATVSLSCVVDPGNGCWSGLAGDMLKAIFPQLRITAIHDERDGRYPGRGPDSANPECLAALCQQVVDRAADIGVAFDGDGDRVSFVDEQGIVLSAEETTHILLQSLSEQLGGSGFVNDVKLSDRIREAAAELGAQPVTERSGHAFIRRTMIQRSAAFGAEISGHYFYGDLQGGDDALYTVCRLIRHLSDTGRPLSAHRRDCPGIHTTPDLRVSVPVADQPELLDEVRNAFDGRPITEIDGIRVVFDNGWALVRPSVTEAALTVRLEGDSDDALRDVAQRFCDGLPRLGPRIRTLIESK